MDNSMKTSLSVLVAVGIGVGVLSSELAFAGLTQHPTSYVGNWCMTSGEHFECCSKWNAMSLRIRPDGFDRFGYSCRLVANVLTRAEAYQGTYFCQENTGEKRWMESNWINPAENTLPRLGRTKPTLIEVVPTNTHLACGIYLKANDRKLCKELNLQYSEELRTPLY
jgi:hypothetical protein